MKEFLAKLQNIHNDSDLNHIDLEEFYDELEKITC